MGTNFVVSPCMKLVTSFDAMERIWDDQRSAPWVEDTMSPEHVRNLKTLL
ncbi:MAG: hypothetical protein WAU61_14665 [Smithella sp.]